MHDAILGMCQERWLNEADCAQSAARWAQHCAHQVTVIITLDGPLGAGKTTFARHMLRALGVTGRVKSPSYTVLESYSTDGLVPPRLLWHFDFYRFSDPHEWEDAGFRDIFAGPGLKLIEWAQHASGHLPAADLRFELCWTDETCRDVNILAGTALGLELLNHVTA